MSFSSLWVSLPIPLRMFALAPPRTRRTVKRLGLLAVAAVAITLLSPIHGAGA